MKNKISKISILIFMSILMLSCAEKKTDNIEKIIIQFFPSFIRPSMIILDIPKEEIIFHHIGTRKSIRFIPPPDTTSGIVYAPESICLHADTLTIAYIRDSLDFDEQDFIDKEVLANDGIANSILYIFESGKVIDIDLRNDITENQHKLILKLIDFGILKSSNQDVQSYLQELKEYY